MQTLDHANSVWLHFFHLSPYTEREINHLCIALFLLLPTAGIKTRLSGHQASALSITPFPLGTSMFVVVVYLNVPLNLDS